MKTAVICRPIVLAFLLAVLPSVSQARPLVLNLPNTIPHPYSTIHAVNVSNIHNGGFTFTLSQVRDVFVFQFNNCMSARYLRTDMTTAGWQQVGNAWNHCTSLDPASPQAHNDLARAIVVAFVRWPDDPSFRADWLNQISYILYMQGSGPVTYIYNFPVFLSGELVYVYAMP